MLQRNSYYTYTWKYLSRVIAKMCVW